jgi:branched-chain amino acid transport system ATP-binding protein
MVTNTAVAPDAILRTSGLTKDFKGFVAVDKVDLSVRRGSIHSLIGPNGAGKTTFFNLLTKFLAPSAGQIFLNGVDITSLDSAQVSREGMCRTFQVSSVFPHLTARQNVRLALQIKHRKSATFWRSMRILRVYDDRVDETLSSVGLIEVRDVLAKDLSYGRKRTLELATTLVLEPQLMLLDEPLAGVGREDIDRICNVIRQAAVSSTVLMVEHNLSAVARLSSMITVFSRGQVLAEGDYQSVASNPLVIDAYIGRGKA